MQVLSTHISDKRATDALKRALARIEAPGWVVAFGDRMDMLAAVQEARYAGKKIVHVGGGETYHYDPSVKHPDHWTRDALSMLSHIHIVANDAARFNLREIDIKWDRIFVTGCPSLDEIVERAKNPKPRTDEPFEWFPESVDGYKPWTGPRMTEAGFLDRLQTCSLFITNSSAGVREAPILGTPVKLVGDRQRGRAAAGTYHHPAGKACEQIALILAKECR